MKILITGGLGFIGGNIAALLLKKGHQITIVSKNNNIPFFLSDSINKLNIISGNYDNEELLNEILPEIDIIIHAASTTVPENSTRNPIFDIESNVISSLKLLSASAKHGIKKIIYLSSGGVVYGKTKELLINEMHPTNPISSYGITKLSIEKYIQLYNKLHNLDYCILRISNVYGPHQKYKNNQGVIANWLSKTYNNENIEIWGDGEIIRDYIYIDDVTNAIELCIEKDITGIYNLGSGIGISLIKLAELMKATIPSNNKIISLNNQRGFDVNQNILDYSLLKEKINWTPRITLAEGIIKTYETLKKQ